VSKAAEILAEEFAIFSRLGRPEPTLVGRGLGSGSALPPDRYNTPIEDLNLSVRAYNCLKRSGLMTVGAVLEKNEDELLALRNFGRKSYDELREKLVSMNFLSEEEMNQAFGVGSGSSSIDGEGSASARTVTTEIDADEELGPVAKALLEALKESGQDDLLESEDGK
jgi:DNA-directed RNA polymerase subunit alpha